VSKRDSNVAGSRKSTGDDIYQSDCYGLNNCASSWFSRLDHCPKSDVNPICLMLYETMVEKELDKNISQKAVVKFLKYSEKETNEGQFDNAFMR